MRTWLTDKGPRKRYWIGYFLLGWGEYKQSRDLCNHDYHDSRESLRNLGLIFTGQKEITFQRPYF